MRDNQPLVSVGMPVYNGEKYIRPAIESLLAQEYERIELIISDNASVDNTREICEGYVKLDSRIRYYRNNENLGPLLNFKRVTDLARGRYFMWAAHDDLWHPSFVRELVTLLSDNSSAVLAVSQGEYINKNGSTSPMAIQFETTLGKSRVQRLAYFFDHCYGVFIYGIWQLKVLVQALTFLGNMTEHWNVDFAIPLLCLNEGDVIVSPQSMFYKRVGIASQAKIIQSKSPWAGTFDPLRSFFLGLECVAWLNPGIGDRLSLAAKFGLISIRKQFSNHYRRKFLSVLRKRLKLAGG